MWVAEQWKDYRIWDCGNGMKAEQWGDYLLLRPDPQVIWPKADSSRYWDAPNAIYHRSRTGGGQWEIRRLPEQWTITYDAPPFAAKPLRFQLKPMTFKHTGLFPEQAVNWSFIDQTIRQAIQPAGQQTEHPIRVLNLFAYTGGATLAAAHAGASVCHVDASRGMVQWARENAALSGLANAPIRWIVDDCTKFVQRELRRGRQYDAIIMDPPSYGRGPSGEMWKIEDNIADFVTLTMGLLSPQPLFVLVSSYSTGLAPSTMAYLLGSTVSKRFAGSIEAQELGLPVESTGLALPCGSSARFVVAK